MNTQVFDSGVTGALVGAKKWAKGYAWIMAVYTALMVIGLIFAVVTMPSVANDMPSGMAGLVGMGFAALLILAMTVIPLIYLFGFVRRSEDAVARGNPTDFAAALSNLKSFFKFYVILFLIVIAFYLIVLVGVFFFASGNAAL